MKTKLRLYLVFLALLSLSGFAQGQGTAVSYQGRLNDGGQPATGLYDLIFNVFDLVADGAALTGPVVLAAVPVTNGLFTVALDFGASVFTGPARWLEIAVRTNGSAATAAYSLLSPRQALTPSPYAIFATTSGTASNVVNGSVVKSLNGLKDNVTLAAGANVTLTPNGNTLTIAATGGGGGSNGIWSLNGASAYYNDGNVGIGTTTPARKLTVRTPDYGIEHTDGTVRLGTYLSAIGGWLVKAMIHVSSFGEIVRCFNGINNTSSGDCGFVVTRPLTGVFRINFGFPVSDRFVSVSAQYGLNPNPGTKRNIGANYRFFDSTSIEVFTFYSDNAYDTVSDTFMIILY